MCGQLTRRSTVQLALALCAVVCCGCTSLPRIDPSGERCFVWPNRQAANPVLASGNQTVAPVFTDPIFPQPVVPPAGTPGATGVAVPASPVPPETLTITPQRVLAPVGTEVILKSGICTDQNFLVTCQKIEWLLARESAGELVSLSGRGLFATAVLPWNQGKKIDNQYGISYTAKHAHTIDRGTPDTSDDVKIEPGHAWASITSPVEGTTYVTAVAPIVEGWPQRRANAVVYWVDVQWEFPPAVISSSSSQILSTVVRRKSDGTPLAGWIVRYEVADNTGALTGGSSRQIVEVVTGTDGRASVDVTPTGGTGSATRIGLQLVRPAELPVGNMPRLIVANSSSTINWNGGNSYLPPADNLGTIPTSPIPGSTQTPAPITPAPVTPTPNPTQPSAPGKPMLDVEIIGNDTGQIGGEARFEVIIRNTGDAPATGLTITDQFDAGFKHPSDNLGTQKIEKGIPTTLAPGQSHKEFITFTITRAGNLCHDLTVRSAEGAETAKRACINVPQAELGKQAGMEVRKDGPRQSTVGETTLFTLSVKNTGEVPLTNVEVLDEYDSALLAKPRTPGFEVIRNADNRSRFLWRLPTLNVGETKRFEVDCTCQAPKQRACSLASVTAEGGPGVGVIPSADEHCIEILESRAPGMGGPADVVPPAGTNPTGLRLSISPYNKKPIVGSRATYQFFLENGSATPDEQIQLRVIFPPELVPDMATLQSTVAAQLVGNELRFNPVAMIRPNERLSFTVTTSVLRAGIVNVVAEAVSSKSEQGVQKTEQVEIVGF